MAARSTDLSFRPHSTALLRMPARQGESRNAKPHLCFQAETHPHAEVRLSFLKQALGRERQME